MDFLVNELSLNGQFDNLESFRESLGRIMYIREVARRFGHQLSPHRELINRPVTAEIQIAAAIRTLSVDRRRAVLAWLNQQGPFWDEDRIHGEDDWYECDGTIVTDTAIGEAAHCVRIGIERGLVSFAHSHDYEHTPIRVDYVAKAGETEPLSVPNHWQPSVFEAHVSALKPPLASWKQLEAFATARFSRLSFGPDTFAPLQGHPFVPGAAERIAERLEVLHRLKGCFDAAGQRTVEGHRLYQNYFTGKKGQGGRGAAFTDSSDSEKRKFQNRLTFRDPTGQTDHLFCPWHGKIQTPQLRIHFTYPIAHDTPLIIVYVGPKLTKS